MALVTLPAEKQDLEVALLSDKFIEELLDGVRKSAGSVVGDLNTAKGRGVYITMADKVRKSKAAFEVRAKDLVAELKARPALIDANRKRFRDEMDKIAVAIRQPVTDWEAEQERIKAEEAAKIKAEEDRKKFESDHEIALLMNDKHDREVAEKKAEAERQRIAHEEDLKRQAAEQAKREAEEKAAAELAAAKKREEDAIAAKAQAELLAKQAQERAEQEAKDAAAKAEAEKKAAIEEEQRKAQEEADRIKREAEAKEATRLAEEKRIADEKAKREADVKHRKAVGTEIVNALTANTSISRDQAIEVLKALMDGLVPRTQINY
ncbi:TPA: hypothetical protein ON591_001425 [Citrobacter freundii]|nr:hypothetical protein [Citrobacter freundii]HCR3475468.1 hypothetical protein [Citrobacter freundii]HED3004459.1 hypothetical protein [Citrobacter freundii]